MSRRSTFLQAEIAVIGSGPGGAVSACTLAEAGKDVLLIEEGPELPLESCIPFSLKEMTQKYRNGGLTVGLGPVKVSYVEGRCVGGGSEINSGLYHRIPGEILQQWRREFQVADLSEENLQPHYDACERQLRVSLVPPGRMPGASRKLRAGAHALGWNVLEAPRCFSYSANSESDGIPGGSKQSMSKTFIPRMRSAGGRLLANTRILRLHRQTGRWVLIGLQNQSNQQTNEIRIEAKTVIVAGGAIQTPALLRRSGIGQNVGNSLRMHPTVKVVALFSEDVSDAAMAVPVHQVKEFAPRITFGCSISTRPHLALGMKGHRTSFQQVIDHPRRAAIYYVMVSGSGVGSIRTVPFCHDPIVRYHLSAEDREHLAAGLANLCRLLLCAGARELYPCLQPAIKIRTEADLDLLTLCFSKRNLNLMTIHLFSSCPMGEDLRRCTTNSFGRVHGHEHLYISDASLLCTSPSVNPQGGIMAIARRNAFAFLSQD